MCCPGKSVKMEMSIDALGQNKICGAAEQRISSHSCSHIKKDADAAGSSNNAGERPSVGICGGTFDPIHYGHLILAEDARDAFGLSRVIFMPSGHSYFKDNRAEKVSSPQDRLMMTRLAVGNNPGFDVSDMEIRREGYRGLPPGVISLERRGVFYGNKPYRKVIVRGCTDGWNIC